MVLPRSLVLARRRSSRKALGSRSLQAPALCFLISLPDGLISLQCRRTGGEVALHLPGLCTQMLSKVPAHKFFLGSCRWQWRNKSHLPQRCPNLVRLKYSGVQIALLMSKYLCSSPQPSLAELLDHAQILSHLLTDNQEETKSRIPHLMGCSLQVYSCNK